MTDKKAINALDPENTPAADDLLYLRKGGGSNVDRKVVLPADSVLRRSVGTGPDDVPDVASFAVTEAGVVPEMIGQGAIVDIIENSNGTAVRWESGLQVCLIRQLELDYSSTSRYQKTWTYPASFLDTPSVVALLRQFLEDDEDAGSTQAGGATGESSADMRLLGSNFSDDLVTVDITAIGFYK